MICASCGTENRPGRKFCLSCGNALNSGCPTCGAENEPQARFCGNCGSPLGVAAAIEQAATQPGTNQAKTATAGQTQRRLVTVMFADLVGFTPFAEERDAEEVRDTLERYSAIAREVVGRYGGTVEKFIGDAVMAVWGTPTAHEDDAERAVRAALELTDSVSDLGVQIQARAGVLTGEAAVNMAATDQNLLAGDLVNTAARLQGAAPPGTVLVGESTMRATSSSIAYEEAGEQTLKGKSAPVPAWQAVRVIAQRRGQGRSETVETPFVGRDEEFRLLREQLHLTGRDPRLRVVSVTGPAGIGKSRLAWELEKYIDGIVENIYWHRGRCPAYGEGVSFWALGEMVRRRAGLAESDSEATTRERLRGTVDQFVVDPTERDWIYDALLVLLGVEQQSAAGRDTLFAAWRRFFENIATQGTTVLVFEDLHWADPGLLDFIDHLLDWSKGAPLLVITLARPELFDRRPDWGAGRRTFTALALDPLPESAMRQMMQALVPDLPESALSAIVARADGIPLYAVETVRMLLADGRLVEKPEGGYRINGELGDLDVPNSLRSLITSRLDGLDAEDRRIIQDGAVLGQTFTLAALADLTGEPPATLEGRLRQLVRRELLTLHQDPRSPERGQYGFTQSLVREVAYSTLTRPQRRERHLAAARHTEAAGGDELAGVLANHYLAAFQASAPGAEADAVAVQAGIALRGAAERASALGGHKQAAGYLSQALEVTTAPADRAALLARHADEIELTGDHDAAIADLHAAIDMYRQLGDAAGLGRVQTLMGHVLVLGGHEKQAVDELTAALAELPADLDPAIRAEMLAKLARAQYRSFDIPAAIATADQALPLAERHRLLRIVADAMVSKGSALQIGTRGLEGIALMRAGYELARRVGDVTTELRAAANLALGVASEESGLESLRLTEAAIETARRVGDFPQLLWHINNRSFMVANCGLPLADAQGPIDELLALNLSDADRANLLRGSTYVRALMGEDVTPIYTEWEAIASTQAMEGRELYTFLPALVIGDFARAADLGKQVTLKSPQYGLAPWAVFAAVCGRDVVQSRDLLAVMGDSPIIGREGAAQHAIARAAVAALEGRTSEAVTEAREPMAVLETMSAMVGYGLAALTLVRAAGPDVPEIRQWAERGLAIFERMGARELAAMIADALAAQDSPVPTSRKAAARTGVAAAG